MSLFIKMPSLNKKGFPQNQSRFPELFFNLRFTDSVFLSRFLFRDRSQLGQSPANHRRASFSTVVCRQSPSASKPSTAAEKIQGRPARLPGRATGPQWLQNSIAQVASRKGGWRGQLVAAGAQSGQLQKGLSFHPSCFSSIVQWPCGFCYGGGVRIREVAVGEGIEKYPLK